MLWKQDLCSLSSFKLIITLSRYNKARVTSLTKTKLQDRRYFYEYKIFVVAYSSRIQLIMILHMGVENLGLLESFVTEEAGITLCFAGINRYCCLRVSTVWYLEATSTLTGSTRHARCNFATFEVIVAENNWVRLSLGMTFRIWSISCSKSMLRSLSASSSTKCFNLVREKPCRQQQFSQVATPRLLSLWNSAQIPYLIEDHLYWTCARLSGIVLETHETNISNKFEVS